MKEIHWNFNCCEVEWNSMNSKSFLNICDRWSTLDLALSLIEFKSPFISCVISCKSKTNPIQSEAVVVVVMCEDVNHIGSGNSRSTVSESTVVSEMKRLAIDLGKIKHIGVTMVTIVCIISLHFSICRLMAAYVACDFGYSNPRMQIFPWN